MPSEEFRTSPLFQNPPPEDKGVVGTYRKTDRVSRVVSGTDPSAAMPLLIILIPSLQFILWLAAIRPYCIRHRLGHTTGANWGVTIWVDWQQAGESAKECGDRGMIRVCRAFLVLQILFVMGVGWLVLRPS